MSTKPTADTQTQDCVVYARYSSHAQKDTSIEDQVRDIESYCRQNNLNIVKVYADRHLTGTTDKRPQFQQMLKDAARGRWAFVVVWKTDRFARNRYDSATYKYRLKRYGVRVLSAKESIPDGPEGILLESVLEGSAEYYSANLAQNVRRGMHANALECKYNGSHMPYGYQKAEDGRFAVLDSEAEIVREIFRKTADGVSFADMQNDLNARGIKTKSGGCWNKNSFRHMLQNTQYIGVYSFADVRVEGGVPAIVDKTLFLEVAEKLKKKKNPQGRHRENGDYLLTGKLFCGHCGAPMIGVSGTGKHGELHYYYSCKNRRSKNGCKKKNITRDRIEQTVVNETLDAVLQDDVIDWIADRVDDYQKRENNSAQLLTLRDELASNQKSISNVMKAIEAGVVTVTTKARLEELEAEAYRLRDAITLEEASITRVDRDFVVFWLQSFRSGDRTDPSFRRKVIDAFVSAVYLYDDRIRIAFNYSGSHNLIDHKMLPDPDSYPPNEEFVYTLYSCANRESDEPCAFIYFVGSVFMLDSPLA